MKFKSLFVEDEQPVKKVAPQAAPATTMSSSLASPYQAPQTPVIAGPDQEIRAALIASINDKKLPGYDYLKYVAALEEMKSMVPAEDARFKIAFSVAKQAGADKVKLAETGQHYIQVLNEDLKEFQSNLAATTQEKVVVRERQLQDLDNAVAERLQQIAQLTELNTKAAADRLALSNEIAETKAKLESKKKSFEVTHAGCVAEIEGNIQKINQYL